MNGHYLVQRVFSIWQTRGLFGFCRFLMTRLARAQSDLVFERDLADRTTPPSMGAGRQMIVIEQSNLNDPPLQDIVAQVLTSESSVYRPGLEHKDIAFAVIDQERRLLHRSFVQFETSYKTLLGETIDMPLLANCHTIPAMRGERLYPKTLDYAGALLKSRGYRRMIITCDEQNEASIRGIMRGGFELKRAIRSFVILARFVIQKIKVDHAVHWRCVRL